MGADAPNPSEVDLSSLRDLPLRVKNLSAGLTKRVAAAARSGPGDVGPISVGRVDGALYPVNEFEVVSGLRRAGADHVDAFVTDYESMPDLLRTHVRRNMDRQEVEPLLVRGMVEYVANACGITANEACSAMWLDVRPDLMSAVTARVTPEAHEVLTGMLDEVLQKVYSANTPAYYVGKIGRVRPDEQPDAATEIRNMTVPRITPSDPASWLGIDSVTTVIRGYHKSGREVPVAERVSRPEAGVKDISKKRKKSEAAAAGARDAGRASRYISDDNDLVYVPLDGGQPDLLINKKTGRVGVVRERDGVYAITDDLGRPSYVLSEEVGRYIGMDHDGNQDVFVGMYGTLDRASKMLAKAKDPGRRCAVITIGSLPRR